MSTILTTRRFALWWRLARKWFESKFSNIKTSTPYITEDGGGVFFNYFSPKQMTKAYIWLEEGNLHFELSIDEEGQFTLTTKSDIQELDGIFVMGGEGNLHDTIIDTIPVYLQGHKVSEVRIEGIDADLLNADFTWKLAEVGTAIGNIDDALDALNIVAKEETLINTKAEVIEARDGIFGKIGDVFIKFGDLTTFIAQRFDWLSGFIVEKKDELQQFILDRKLELHNLIAVDILGTINSNHGTLLGQVNDIRNTQNAFENNSVTRANNIADVVNSQGEQLGKHLDEVRWEIDAKIDNLHSTIDNYFGNVMSEEEMLNVLNGKRAYNESFNNSFN